MSDNPPHAPYQVVMVVDDPQVDVEVGEHVVWMRVRSEDGLHGLLSLLMTKPAARRIGDALAAVVD